MLEYFSYANINGDFTLHETLEEAKTEAQSALNFYRNDANDEGWPEGLAGSIGYGKICGMAVEKRIADRNDFTDEEWEEEGHSLDFSVVSDYSIREISNE